MPSGAPESLGASPSEQCPEHQSNPKLAVPRAFCSDDAEGAVSGVDGAGLTIITVTLLAKSVWVIDGIPGNLSPELAIPSPPPSVPSELGGSGSELTTRV